MLKVSTMLLVTSTYSVGLTHPMSVNVYNDQDLYVLEKAF